MYFPWVDLNCRHPITVLCSQGTNSNIQRLAEEDSWSGVVMEFQAYRQPLEIVTSFKYLGRLLTATDDYFIDVIVNLQKAQKSWYHLSSILGGYGEEHIIIGCFYLAMVQSVLLFSAETWVVTLQIVRLLGSFHHKVERRMVVIQPQRRTEGSWDYPPLEYDIHLVGL